MKQNIEKLAKGQFKISWDGLPDSIIHLDFNPILTEFKLYDSATVLEHWQAKPLNLRRWGLYDVLNDKYYSVEAHNIIFLNGTKSANLQISDQAYPNIRPTAVKYYEPVSIKPLGDERYMIGSFKLHNTG
jgi:hypothetical protein